MEKNFSKLKEYIFSELKKLPKNILYHNIEHTKDVLKTTEKLAKIERVSKEDLAILKTAALLHDVGFLDKYQGHEHSGKKIARKILPKFGYNKKEIQKISNIILSTKMPQNPKTKNEKILCDADLDNLGRNDFFKQTEKIRKELWNQGTKIEKEKWYLNTLKLLENHEYHTKSARKLRDKGKDKNIKKLKSILAK